MEFRNHRFWYAVATLIGTIVGVGIFGLPFVFSQSGFLIGVFYLLILGLAVLFIHLIYGETILRTNEPHRLVGYAGKYLGQGAKRLSTMIVLIEYYGSLLAYIIVGGEFLNILFSRWLGSEFLWSLFFFFLGAWAIFLGIKTVAKTEFFMTVLLLATVAILIWKGWGAVDWGNLSGLNFSKFFLPYGVILFSLAGSAAIPEIRQILVGQEHKLKKAIICGTVIPAIIYFFFALVIVGITGIQTSAEAIKGLIPHLGSWVINLGAFFGILAIFTSFLVLGLNLKRVFQYDWRINSFPSFVLACAVPLVAYLAGFKNFILLIGFIGAIAGGLDAILTILIYLKVKKAGDRKPEFSLKWGKQFAYLAMVLFVLGIIYQFIYLAS